MRMDRRTFLQAGLGAAALAAGRPKPNIVFLYADDVGYGDLSCYGATKVQTPNLDRIARAGVRFTNAHSPAATCTPSRYTALTGEYAWRRQGTGILPGDASAIIRPGKATIASVLRERGYRSAAVGKWHLGLGTGEVDWNGSIEPGPLEIGFDYSFLIPATGDRVPCVYVENHRVVGLDPKDPIRVSYRTPFPGEPLGKERPDLLRMQSSHGHNQAIVNGVGRIGYMTGGRRALWVDEEIAPTITEKALRFMDGAAGKPFFLYLATHDIHVPRLPGKRFQGASGLGARGDAILELDWTVGQVLDYLDRKKLAENTLLVFSSDNGPVVDDGYRDESVEKLNGHRPAGEFRGGKYSNFDAGTRVPLLVRWPGVAAAGRTSETLFSQVDLLASFAAVAGARVPEGAGPDSVDASAVLTGRSRKGRAFVVEQAGVLAVIEGTWKYIEPGKGPRRNEYTNIELGNDPAPQLFDLRADPGERVNVAAGHPEKVRELAEKLAAIRAAGAAR